MIIKEISTKDLIPYQNNARTHTEDQVSRIASSIKEFGFCNPVLVDNENGIIAGHGRVLAAKKLKIKSVPTVCLDHLTTAQKKAYILADNRIALDAGWDDELLKLELATLRDMDFDISLTGFDEDEIAALSQIEVEGLTDEDDVPEPPEEPTTVVGDLWLLENHRLLCGDSASPKDVGFLIGDGLIDMVFTDPPYNIDYQGISGSHKKIKNDNMSDMEFVKFLKQSLLDCETMYVCCSWQCSHLFKLAMGEIARKPKAMIVWDKVNPAQHLDKYFKQHEIIFYYGDFGGETTLRGDVWQLKRQKNTLHPTMKPVELIDIVMSDQPNKKTIYDPFGGSGSTLVSCEKNQRNCIMMELEPKYCDVIINRWQEYTGKKATHENGKTFDKLRLERAK